ncbi:hypothetical protein [Allopontixanthobacter sp.]|uniref:hypothetical protein n=1 Tax=Allopontixanthobacter sp. TaxID=2906452 RepID=UPI002ABC9277|nr:hypothetical protein [Allopontixanthobacter sp.]MDZ4308315.1 hypothetical protein [Allopontixanthobacter sp.]
MKFSTVSLALLIMPALASAQSAPVAAVKPLSMESRTALRCSAAFALVADGQARADRNALAYPALGQRGREFFVRTSARVMDDTGMDRDAVATELGAEARRLWDGGGFTGEIDRIMPACLLLLETSGA